MFKDNSQKRLLEVMHKLDARDKSKLNEWSPYGSIAFDGAKERETPESEKKEWNVYSQNPTAFGQDAKDKKHVHRYFDTEEEAIKHANYLNHQSTGAPYKVGKTNEPEISENFEQPEEFIPHGSYTVSNSGGYEIMLNDAGDAAKVRDAFGSDNPQTSDWLEIEYVNDEETGESEPVIDPQGYNIPLNQVMRINN